MVPVNLHLVIAIWVRTVRRGHVCTPARHRLMHISRTTTDATALLRLASRPPREHPIFSFIFRLQETSGPQWPPRAARAVRPLHLPVAVLSISLSPVHSIYWRERERQQQAARSQPLPLLFPKRVREIS
jgi:hypothetical protein